MNLERDLSKASVTLTTDRTSPRVPKPEWTPKTMLEKSNSSPSIEEMVMKSWKIQATWLIDMKTKKKLPIPLSKLLYKLRKALALDKTSRAPASVSCHGLASVTVVIWFRQNGKTAYNYTWGKLSCSTIVAIKLDHN